MAMPLKGACSAKTMKKLAEFWKDKKYLIINEMSMLSREFLAKVSKIISTVLRCTVKKEEMMIYHLED